VGDDSDWVVRWHSQTGGNPGAFLSVQDDGQLVIYSAAGAVLWSVFQPLSVSASVTPASVLPGATVTATASGSGGVAPLQYKFWLCNEGTSTSTLLRDYGTGTSVTWTPTTADVGTYHVQVWVRNAGSTADLNASANTASFAVGSSTPAGTRMTSGQYLVSDQKLYSPNRQYWVQYQPNNDLVFYTTGTSGWRTIWRAHSDGYTPGKCKMESTGNLVVYDASGMARWKSYTSGHTGAYLSVQDNGQLVIYSASGAVLWSQGTAASAPPTSPEARRPGGPTPGESTPGGTPFGWLLALLVSLAAVGAWLVRRRPRAAWRVAAPVGLALLLNVLAPAIVAGQTTVEYYHVDALGSVRAVTNEAGEVIIRHDFLPFGQEWGQEEGTDPRRFTGKERDPETGLDYFGARYYRANVGRFTTVDPVGGRLADSQTLNKYAYARNNPLRFVDPAGLYQIDAACASDRACAAEARRFETQRQRDLQSRDAAVRRGTAAYGNLGVDNGVTVNFGDQAVVDSACGGSGASGCVTFGYRGDATGSTVVPHLPVMLLRGLNDTELRRAIAHEGSHVEDDLALVNSFDRASVTIDSARNFFRYDTEFKAYAIGTMVDPSTPYPLRGSTPEETYGLIDRFLLSSPMYAPQLWRLAVAPGLTRPR
jgi:RHS repeat-associated protein